jgi:hypothetical protein
MSFFWEFFPTTTSKWYILLPLKTAYFTIGITIIGIPVIRFALAEPGLVRVIATGTPHP